ncbi:ribonuclease M5 [Paucilactobacillus hokkaidonensis JCM 18461]|uniref:Ribonuclease M5 n=2 Tax=Paucilactobacillus hokkaidonensis TaxID=1193095 RepID=A0A0A1GWX1_9LACO|nr:ribonuclease M5 [Paucilactobacillus hokkaidonensis]KRO09684.1 ribonuclease M5 [Paucilactobacillus hokkaidonensis]BAP84941.1 ribonuclease M5 [Paucilactobacillus hokkaidonensis JCM 18461]
MQKIKEIIVVEGKDDTKKILRAVNADTFETNGSALSSADIERLKKLQQKRGLIVFTDPDFNGERIRKMISTAIPGVKHAFINRNEGIPDIAGGSLGVEHATPATILAALKHVYTQETDSRDDIFSTADLRKVRLINDDHARLRREKIGDILGIGYGNGKQLLKRLNLFQITKQQFEEAVVKLNQEENNE